MVGRKRFWSILSWPRGLVELVIFKNENNSQWSVLKYRKIPKIGPRAYIFNLPFLLCFTLYLREIFQVQAPGGLIFGGFFVLPVWGACIWRGLFSEFYGNLIQQNPRRG